tara:strand:- start:2095 stop:2637 length:543 start_codon:yes stop_codon:yes gene_type:complete
MAEDKNLVINKRAFDISFYEIELKFNNTKVIEYLKNHQMIKEEMLTTYYEYKNVLEEKELEDFKNHIYNHVNLFVKNVLKKEKVILKESWFQAYETNSYHPIHVHGVQQKDWSLIYYVQASPTSAKTIMHIPGYPYVPEIKKQIVPKKDLLVMFPSYFPHQVELNQDSERIILSANLEVF